MPRKPHQPAELGDTAGPMPTGHTITIASEEETKAIESEMAFEAARLLGQIEASQFSARCAEKVMVEVFIKLKQNKAYKAIHIKDDAGNTRRCAHLDEFCEHFLGKSARSVQELVANYHTLGADLFEQAERLGFKRNDYRVLKALPADDQEAIKAAMQPEVDRDQILDLMQELAVRHASEKAQLNTNIQTKEADLKARDAREAKLNADNHELLKKVIRIEEATPQEDYAMLAAELAKCVYSIQTSLMSLRAGFSKLILKGDEHGIAYHDTLVGHVTQLHRELNRVRNEYGLPIEPDKTEVERGFEFAEAELAREQAERDHTIN